MRLCLALSIALLAGSAARACTTFCLQDPDRVVFGQNYDWDVDAGLVVANGRGVRKTSFDQTPTMTWVSEHGSITFNQYGVEFPVGGMNERGLTIATMWLNATEYGPPDGRAGLNVLQWIQYHLDVSETVGDVVASDVRIAPYAPGIGLHYLVADPTGDVAAIEVLDGRQVVHRGESLAAPVLTNNTYEESLAHLRRHAGFGGGMPLPERRDSLSRFVRAASAVRSAEPAEPDARLAILELASDPVRTQWSIVYDTTNRRIVWRTKANPNVRTVSFDEFDFACGATPPVLDIHRGAGGVAAEFAPVTPQRNLALVTTAFRNTPQAGLNRAPDEAIRAVAGYAGTVECAE